MKIQRTTLFEMSDEKALIEMVLSFKPDIQEREEFVHFRVSIPSDPSPLVPELHLVALKRTKELIDAHIRRLQALAGRTR